MSIIDKVLFYKEDPVFGAAKDLLRQFKEKTKNPDKEIKLNLPLAQRILVFPGDKERSPGITCFGEKGRFVLIDFPKNSKPYEDHMTTETKECMILEGNIWDANNPNMKPWGTGDKFIVQPWQNIAPHTKDTPALALITLQK